VPLREPVLTVSAAQRSRSTSAGGSAQVPGDAHQGFLMVVLVGTHFVRPQLTSVTSRDVLYSGRLAPVRRPLSGHCQHTLMWLQQHTRQLPRLGLFFILVTSFQLDACQVVTAARPLRDHTTTLPPRVGTHFAKCCLDILSLSLHWRPSTSFGRQREPLCSSCRPGI
jgi:hypothetical protein